MKIQNTNRTIANRSIIAILLISIAAGGVLASALDSGTKSITVGRGGNGWFRLGISANNKVRITAKADHGKAYIKVVGPKGKTVARGVNRVRFQTDKQMGRYKIILTNKTKKVQKVKVSYTATDDLWD